MRFILTPQAWILAELDPIEWSFLERLPELAAGGDFSEDQRRRLLPDPIDVPAGQRREYEGFLEDWDEYVRPDLMSAFASARDRVSRDLDFARARLEETLRDVDAPGEASGYPKMVAIARESADAWYSTLNQARLLMNEAHDLAESMDWHRLRGGKAAKGGSPPDAAKFLLMAQYEFFTALQSILIETIMRAGLDGDDDDGASDEEEEE